MDCRYFRLLYYIDEVEHRISRKTQRFHLHLNTNHVYVRFHPFYNFVRKTRQFEEYTHMQVIGEKIEKNKTYSVGRWFCGTF